MTGFETASRMLDVIENNILPLTRTSVEEGHNIFGGAVLGHEDLSLVTAGTNMRGDDPTLHGEIVTINRFFKLKERPLPEETVFLATHEPCSMCLSALAWSGFRKIFFLFGYEETRDDFGMGGDLQILAEIFSSTVPSRKNSYFELLSIRDLVNPLPERETLLKRIELVRKEYLLLAEKVFILSGNSGKPK